MTKPSKLAKMQNEGKKVHRTKLGVPLLIRSRVFWRALRHPRSRARLHNYYFQLLWLAGTLSSHRQVSKEKKSVRVCVSK